LRRRSSLTAALVIQRPHLGMETNNSFNPTPLCGSAYFRCYRRAPFMSQTRIRCRESLPAPNPGDQKFNRRRVVPTVFGKKPFGESFEGLSPCGGKSCDSRIAFGAPAPQATAQVREK
jgi:hypothetical protein